MVKKKLFLDLHLLQTLPPSCINRDDTGSPKTAVYGGVTRARVSSQSWKRAIRRYFQERLKKRIEGIDYHGYLSKYAVDKIADAIRAIDPEADADKLAKKALTDYAGIKLKSKTDQTAALLFFSEAQAQALANLITSGETDKDLYKNALRAYPAVDMALFGRMVADDATLNYDACVQVAHAISTHEVRQEFDYFTAVDDLKAEDSTDAGAGHIGSNGYNSSTLYRYATVDISDLAEMMGKDTPEIVADFAEAFINSMPTGKQNSFAANTMPYFIYATIREDRPLSFAGAFEEPARKSLKDGGGYEGPSEDKLVIYAERVHSLIAGKPLASFVTALYQLTPAPIGTNRAKETRDPSEYLEASSCTQKEMLQGIADTVRTCLSREEG